MRADPRFEELRTSRLRLRRSEPRDAEEISAYRSDPEVHAHQGWDRTDPDHVRQEIEEMLQRVPGGTGGWVQFTVETLADDQLVGDVGLRVAEDEPGVVMIGYTMAPAA
jgi:RimJ/RimL family protein N-acetyltransferase